MDGIISDRLNKTVGVNIRRIRRNAGMSISQAAQHIGISELALLKMENGLRPSHAVEIYKLAILFDIPMEQFFRRDP